MHVIAVRVLSIIQNRWTAWLSEPGQPERVGPCFRQLEARIEHGRSRITPQHKQRFVAAFDAAGIEGRSFTSQKAMIVGCRVVFRSEARNRLQLRRKPELKASTEYHGGT